MSDDPPPKGPSAQEKQERKAQRAQEGAKAMIEYRNREMAMRDRTAKLRAQRLAREAGEAVPKNEAAPKKKKKDEK
jgi:hypothetical protein